MVSDTKRQVIWQQVKLLTAQGKHIQAQKLYEAELKSR